MSDIRLGLMNAVAEIEQLRIQLAAAETERDELRAELAAAREALRQILAIELDKYGSDWCEIEQVQDIARAALGGRDE